MPAFNLNLSVSENIDSEIKISYGKAYWELMDALGSEDTPIECD